MQKVLVILGPTASGKSNLAIRLAKLAHGKQFKKIGIHGAEIISADSRQVYKGLNVGTGKITKKEMKGVPHHLLDVASPKTQFSVDLFISKAKEAIKLIEARDALPIVVGGTGFYIDALAGKISLPDVAPNKSLRRKLNKFSKEKLFKMLQKKDPRRAKNIDPNNKVRLVRALEIIDSLGKVPKLQHSVLQQKFIYVGLKPENLNKRIEKRVKKMFKDGLLNEIKKLKLSDKRLKELGFEYWHPTEESVIRGTKRYAKRQMTWFKRNKEIKWFILSAVEGLSQREFRKIEKYVKEKI